MEVRHPRMAFAAGRIQPSSSMGSWTPEGKPVSLRHVRHAHPGFSDYALLDSGNGEKLERFGEVVLRRPDPQALWRPRQPETWGTADLRFERDPRSGGQRGRWLRGEKAHPAALQGEWPVHCCGLTLIVRPTPFKHVGFFPEQACNWQWIQKLAAQFEAAPSLLNLFAYTGAGSIVARRAGFSVTHVDASRTAMAWTRENAAACGLGTDELRLVLDDALSFARREVRRGARYQGLILDPPHHGRGPEGETWQFETDFAPLIETCRSLLAERSFLIVSSYAVALSPIAFENLLPDLGSGSFECGELALPEERAREDLPARFLPAGLCARWWRGLSVPP